MYVLLTPLTFTIVLAPDFAHAEPLEMVAARAAVEMPVETRSALTKSVATDILNIFFPFTHY
jgi:hypothetical protein